MVMAAGPAEGAYVIGDVEVNELSREVRKAGEVVRLSFLEFNLLLVLAKNADRALSKSYLVTKVWNDSLDGKSRSVDQHIFTLRQKLERDPNRPRLIVTVRGYGFRIPQSPTRMASLPR